MRELFEAIYSHYLDDPLASKLAGFYNTEAPQEAAFPYCVFSLVSDVQEFSFSESFENCLIQFNLFSKNSSPEEVCKLFELLKGDVSVGTGFDFLDLPIDNYEPVSLVRENAILTREDDVWMYNVTYRMFIQKVGEVVRPLCNKFYNLLSI